MPATVDLDDKIFDFVYIAAIRDATQQKSYEGEKQWLYSPSVFPTISKRLKEFIGNVVNNHYKTQKEFDNDFLSLAVFICEEIAAKAGNCEFTFGNAQKLINITLKFFYITTYKNSISKDAFQYCHCPMDGIMLKHVWDNRTLLKKVKLDSNFTSGWGREDFDRSSGTSQLSQRYKVYQEAIRELCKSYTHQNGKDVCPIEYDYCIWGN